MIKAITLLYRKEGLTREEFVRHYEEVHAPMAVQLLPMYKKYVRNHVVGVPDMIDVPDIKGPDFDCVSEFWFDSIEDAMALMDRVQSEAGQPIRDDEQKFMDTSKTMSFMVDERESKL